MYFTVEDWGGKSCSFITGNDVTIIFNIFEGGLYFFSFFLDPVHCCFAGWEG